MTTFFTNFNTSSFKVYDLISKQRLQEWMKIKDKLVLRERHLTERLMLKHVGAEDKRLFQVFQFSVFKFEGAILYLNLFAQQLCMSWNFISYNFFKFFPLTICQGNHLLTIKYFNTKWQIYWKTISLLWNETWHC